MSSAREEILGRLRKATHLVQEVPQFNQPVFPPVVLPLETTFKNQLETISGKAFLVNSEKELSETLKNQLSDFNPETIFCNEPGLINLLNDSGIACSKYTGSQKDVEVGITGCEFLITRSGSVMVSSEHGGGRQLSVYPAVHIVIADKSQLVEGLDEAYSEIAEKYPNNLPSQIALITGPSRTADIEKTLVLGAHGPKEIWVFVLL